MMKSTVTIQTKEGAMYIGKLCRHFKHKIEATYEGNQGTAQFPWGPCQMLAEPEALTFNIEAENEEGLDKIKGAIDRHLIKFAFREELVIEWKDGAEIGA